MANWTFNSNDYTAREFALIPEGDHRVRITKVVEKVFNSGNEGFEITLDVNGHNSKLWYYLILDPTDRQRTNQRLGMFFDSFAITDYNLSNYDSWLGKDGAVRVRHGAYKGTMTAQVAFCLGRKQQDRLPRWQHDNNYVSNSTYDFCNSVPANNSIPRQQLKLDGFTF
jgi:hypothetical protein